MTPQAVLVELLNRIAAQNGDAVLIGATELAQWPLAATNTLKTTQLLTAASPARSAVCPGCEQECTMPVEVLPASGARLAQAFIVCDKRSDVNRVALALDSLPQWQISGEATAEFLRGHLEIPGAVTRATAHGIWRIGVFRGGKQAAHLELNCVARLQLSLAGHTFPLDEILRMDADKLVVDRPRLVRAADAPVGGAGTKESREQRRERLQRRVNELRAKGVRNFNQLVADEEGIHVSRLQQLLTGNEEKPKKRKPATWLD